MSGKFGLVLAGGAARGAYEAGVVLHLVEEVARDLGHDVPIDIISGTSVGAINASALAAFADQPRARGALLAAHWMGLKLNDVVHPNRRVIGDSLRLLFGRQPVGRAGILDPSGIERVIERAVPFHRIDQNLRAGHLDALTVSTTHVTSGRTVVFSQHSDRVPAYCSNDPTIVTTQTTLRAEHALASAAIPFVFPSVSIDGDYYCDGGLRQNVPLAPALQMGADRLLVVSPRAIQPIGAAETKHDPSGPGPFFLLGKALGSLLLDRVDSDLDRLQAINDLMMTGQQAYGPSFTNTMNNALAASGRRRVRPIQTTLIRASVDISALATEHVRSQSFAKRVGGLGLRVLRQIADTSGASDLLSYLLFDGEFAAQLIELGRADARARHAELCALFSTASDEQLAA